MVTPETGVYVEFFDEGEPADKQLPPLGPFELLIVRHNQIIGGREHVEHDIQDMMGVGSVERWLEAELELRRALGDEPGGVHRGHMRIRAPRGDIIVRFYDYAGDEPPKVPELGPFYSLTVGKREVRADDKLLAIRSTDMSAWTLTDAVRPGVAGINKADFSVFSLSARDPRVLAARQSAPLAQAPIIASASAPPSAEPPQAEALTTDPPAAEPPYAGPQPDFVERRRIQREIYVSRPDPQRDEALTPADVNLILRVDKLKQQELAEQLMIERLRREQHVSPETALNPAAAPSVPMRFQPPVKERAAAQAAAAEAEADEGSLTERVLRLLWAGRLFLVSALVIMAAVSAYGYLQPRATASGEPPPLTFVALGQKVTTSAWTYTVASVERPVRIGTTPASKGGYLIVHVTVSRKDADARAVDPSDFTLIDETGAGSFAFAPSSDIYAASTGITWATRYPLNASVQDHLVFDVNPTARGLLLLIKPANVEVRLPDP
jgi:hypothetical protein